MCDAASRHHTESTARCNGLLLCVCNCVCWLLGVWSPPEAACHHRTSIAAKKQTTLCLRCCLNLQVCVLDAQSGGVYLKLPANKDWPLAPASDTYPGACDGMLR